MNKVFKRVAIGLAVAALGIQFIRPTRANPPVDDSRSIQSQTSIPREVATILERSCRDCHSNNTQWPWYSNIAPVSWWIANHVSEGRRELMFSEWSSYTPKKAARKLEEICEQIESGEMPLKSYLLLHPGAALSQVEKQILCNWATDERDRLLASE